jgi:transcriptional regulator with XRE-family HTH domain
MTGVAKQAGMSQQMVSYVERGMRRPTLETLLQIAAVLDVDLWNLVKAASATEQRS